MHLRLGLVALFAFSLQFLMAQHSMPKDFCINAQESELFQAANDLREAYGKPRLQHSSSLTYVAQLHVDDLMNNHPDTSICNLSSWSDKGNWSPCCYNSYIPNPECMWGKPKELTSYPYRGYEMVVYFDDKISLDSLMKLWSDSKEMLDMLLTRGAYEQKKWICMGLAMNDHYASIWFGQRRDRASEPKLCETVDTTAVVQVAERKETDAQLPIYYVIFGSFDNIKDAREALKRIKKNGYDDAGILTKNNHFRIYLLQFSSLKEAMFAKQGLPYTYNEAWILKD